MKWIIVCTCFSNGILIFWLADVLKDLRFFRSDSAKWYKAACASEAQYEHQAKYYKSLAADIKRYEGLISKQDYTVQKLTKQLELQAIDLDTAQRTCKALSDRNVSLENALNDAVRWENRFNSGRKSRENG